MHVTGTTGGAWNEETHKKLQNGIENFNSGLAKHICEVYNPTSVLEFGSGLGFLAKHISENTNVQNYHCIEPYDIQENYSADGNPKLFAIDIFHDEIPEEMNRTYDLVMSIEVAEHVPRELHTQLFDFMYERAENFIIFSGARIGQGGHGHIACRSEEDWRSEWLSRGAIFLPEETQAARASCNRRNINHIRNVQIFLKP